jgi:hypothetical protein
VITPLIYNSKLNTKNIPRSTLIGHKCKQNALQSVKNTDLVLILYGRLRTGLEHLNPRTVNILLASGASVSIIQYKYLENLSLKQQ